MLYLENDFSFKYFQFKKFHLETLCLNCFALTCRNNILCMGEILSGTLVEESLLTMALVAWLKYM
jgi:hypothetical protein